MRFTYTLLTARPCLRMNLCPTSPFCVCKHLWLIPFRQRYHRTTRRIKTKEQDPRKLESKSSRLKRHQCCPCREVPSAASASGSNAGLAAGLAGDGFLSVVRNGYANAAARRHVSTCIQLYRQDHPRSKEKYLKICIVFQAILGLQLAPGQLRFFVAWPLRCEENVQSCAIHRIPLHWSVSLSSIVCIISSWISPYVPLRKNEKTWEVEFLSLRLLLHSFYKDIKTAYVKPCRLARVGISISYVLSFSHHGRTADAPTAGPQELDGVQFWCIL